MLKSFEANFFIRKKELTCYKLNFNKVIVKRKLISLFAIIQNMVSEVAEYKVAQAIFYVIKDKNLPQVFV